jgi:hypothetical protein
MTNKEMLLAVSTVASVLVAGIAFTKVSRLCRRLNTSLDDIERKTTFEISDELVDEVVSDMAKRKLDRIIPAKVQETVDDIKKDAIKTIESEIKTKVTEIKPEIAGQLNKMVDDVRIDKIKAEVIENAAEKAKKEVINDIRNEKDSMINLIRNYEKQMEGEIEDHVEDVMDDLESDAKDKFEEELDNLTTRYKSRLDDVSSIYSSLANKMTRA